MNEILTARRREPPTRRASRAVYRAAVGLRSSLAAPLAGGGGPPRIFYGGARAGDIGGPLVKVKRLREHFPEHRWRYNLIYSLSGAPYLPGAALRLLKRRGVAIVGNQNGVFNPAWYDGDWRAKNAQMAQAYHLADHIFWQSEFCRVAADRFLGVREGTGEVLYNAVDTGHFRPREERHVAKNPNFLVTGKFDGHMFYRIEASLRGLAAVRAGGLEARLTLAGWISPEARDRCRTLVNELDLGAAVSVTGPYGQEEAPAIYGAADAYLMLKHNDPCPNVVLEALACGLPVLYSATGGVAELVGDGAGIGLACEADWERAHWPDARAVADGMAEIAGARDTLAAGARRRAVERFDIGDWIARHRAIFEGLIEDAG